MNSEETKSERISNFIQTNIIRRWSFLLFFTVTTVLAIIFTNYIPYWNVWASWLAVMVEGIVGRAMWSMSKRDGQIIRDLRILLNEVHLLIGEIKKLTDKEVRHSEMDYEVDLDSNQKLTQVLEILTEDDHWGTEEYDLT